MDMTFKKRAGTSGISGHLYETKLISLILFRLLHDDDVEEFCLASNMDEVGAFDDICIKLKIAGRERPILVFIQTKHKEDENTNLNYDLIKNFHASLVKVKENFYTSKNVFFNENFNETECLFVLYTNAKYLDDSVSVDVDQISQASEQIWRPYQSAFSDKLNDLIGTTDKNRQGSQVTYTNKDMEFVNDNSLEQEIATLAEHFAKFLNNKANQSMNIMLDKYILKYHVILAQSVVNISEIKSDEKKPIQWRDLTIRSDFFTAKDKYLTMLRKKLFKQIVKNISPSEIKTQAKKKRTRETRQKATEEHDTSESCCSSTADFDESTVEKLISTFLSEPSALTLSPLIGTDIVYKKGNLKFIDEKSEDDVQKLKQIKISQATIDEAEAIVATNILLSLKLKVPDTFGNIDLTIGGNDKKVEKRLNTLSYLIDDLCENSQSINSYKIIKIDNSIGEGFLSINGGIGAAIGNVLIYDGVTKLLKFVEDSILLKSNAKALFNRLSNKIHNLHLYRLDTTALITFPKLVFDYTDVAEGILDKVVIYEKQSNHNGVEAILKKEIDTRQKLFDLQNLPVKSDTMFIQYHNEIQKWWMSPKSEKYLTKSKNDNIFQQAVSNIVAEPQISAMQTMYNMNNIKYFGYDFNETAMKSLISLDVDSKTIIKTNMPTLTTIKVIRCIRNKYVVLDLECTLNLPSGEFFALTTELINTEKNIIVVCKTSEYNRNLIENLNELAKAIANKKIVVITTNSFVETARDYFGSSNIIYDQEQSLVDLIPEVQKDIIKNARVIFQGQSLSLDLLLDDESLAFINGAVFSKIIHNEIITLSKPLDSSGYKEIKHLYIDRRLNRSSNCNSCSHSFIRYSEYGCVVKTFYDIEDDIVLITSAPGVGKSTLLTRLSLNTMEVDRKLWIVRINLLEQSKILYKWQRDKTVIDNLETIKFICRIILQNNDVKFFIRETNGKMHLESCTGDELATFELNMFFYFYNERRLIFLFDGFDEICPNYKTNVIKVFKVIKNLPRKHKMWVTSRPYTDILSDLERVLGESYEIEYIDKIEQGQYLKDIWHTKLKFENISNIQLQNIMTFTYFTSKQRDEDKYLNSHSLHLNVCLFTYFFEFVRLHFPLTNENTLSPGMRVLESKLYPFGYNDNFYKQYNIKYGRVLDKFMGTPLHLYLLADYIVNLVSVNEVIECWKVDVNRYSIYGMFIESKLKTVLFQDKNKTDITNPDVMRRYDKEYADCINMYKRLAAHSLLVGIFDDKHELQNMRPFKNVDSSELDAMLNIIKNGTEKAGLISHVTDYDEPVFIHRTIAEYFAAEYVYEIIKSDKFELHEKKRLLSVLNDHSDVLKHWLKHKTHVDSDFKFIYLNCSSQQN